MTRYIVFTLSLILSLGLLLPGGALLKTDSAFAKSRSLGKVRFKTSCNRKAQKRLNMAVALLHHMMYKQAKKEFLNAADLDPSCAMAFWGYAMTQFHPLWAPPSKSELLKGNAAIQKAIKLNPEDPREQDYISAVEAFYNGWEAKDHKSRIAAWSDGQKVVLDNNPNDVDATAFYALSLLATAPKKDKEFTNQKKAGEMLENLRKKNRRHPGLFHYTIHAYDNPALAERGVKVANGYAKIAPNVPHALHMPSHIFVRLGMWPETINWNTRSAKAAEEQSKEIMSFHYLHAVDYLIYAYIQQGQYHKAENLLEKVNSIEKYQDSFGSAYGIAGAQSRSIVEQKKWEEAATMKVRTHSKFPWDKYPQYEAITYYVRGLGAARSGNIESAMKDKAMLDQLYTATVNNGQSYWAIIVDAQRQTVDAWIVYSGGDKAAGLQMMQAAADLEDSVDKHPVTPGSVMPARDMLGDMFLMSDKPGDALTAYEASLKISPKRFYSLYSAGYSAEKAGDSEKAVKYYSELVDVTARADKENERIAHAKDYINNS